MLYVEFDSWATRLLPLICGLVYVTAGRQNRYDMLKAASNGHDNLTILLAQIYLALGPFPHALLCITLRA